MESNLEARLTKSCKQEECNVSINGKCLEGLSLEQCPHFYLESEDYIQFNAIEKKSNNYAPLISVSSGDALEINDTTNVSYKYNSRLIIILGDSDSGKTTLSATIHELFQRSPFNGLWFAGSITPIAFEKRCHFSRVISGAQTPKTEKTRANEFQFLHLALKRKDNLKNPAHHLLISDVSGELYKLARNSSEVMKSLLILKSAYRVLLTLDGEKLANKKFRNSVLINAKSFIKKAIEEKIINKNTRLDFVITKWDVLQYNLDPTFESIVKDELSSILKDIVLEFSFVKIAARPNAPVKDVQLGYGIKELLDLWLRPDLPTSSSDQLIDILSKVPNTSKRHFISMLGYMIKTEIIE